MDPYQLTSRIVASMPATDRALTRPAALPLAWTTRSASSPAGASVRKLIPSAFAISSRDGSTSTTDTRVAGIWRQGHERMDLPDPQPARCQGPQDAESQTSVRVQDRRARWPRAQLRGESLRKGLEGRIVIQPIFFFNYN